MQILLRLSDNSEYQNINIFLAIIRSFETYLAVDDHFRFVTAYEAQYSGKMRCSSQHFFS